MPRKKEVEIVLDVETTGLDYTKEKIIEFAGVRLENGKIVDSFETLVNPHQKIRKSSMAIHGITDEMLENPGKAPSVSRAKVSERHVRPTLAMPREAMYVIYEGKHYPIDAVVTGQQFLQELALKPPVQGSRPQLVLIDQEGSDIGIVPLDEPLCDLGVGGWRVNVQWMETAK